MKHTLILFVLLQNWIMDQGLNNFEYLLIIQLYAQAWFDIETELIFGLSLMQNKKPNSENHIILKIITKRLIKIGNLSNLIWAINFSFVIFQPIEKVKLIACLKINWLF